MNNEYSLIAIIVAIVFFFAIYYLIAKVIRNEAFDEAYQLGKKHGAENRELEDLKLLKYALCKKCDTLYSYRYGDMNFCPACGAKMEEEDAE